MKKAIIAVAILLAISCKKNESTLADLNQIIPQPTTPTSPTIAPDTI